MAHELKVKTDEQTGCYNLTNEMEVWLQEIGVEEGVCVLFAPHTTAALATLEFTDPTVGQDLLIQLGHLFREGGRYEHREANAPAHVKASIVGASVHIPVSGGRPLLGRWQGVFLCEFDGPRERTVWMQAARAFTGDV